MLLRQSAGPSACQFVFERFGSADAAKGAPDDRFDNIQNPQSDAAVVSDPVAKILQKLWLKDSL